LGPGFLFLFFHIFDLKNLAKFPLKRIFFKKSNLLQKNIFPNCFGEKKKDDLNDTWKEEKSSTWNVMGNGVSKWKGTCVPLLEPFCVCPEKKRTCVTLPRFLLFLPPKKHFVSAREKAKLERGDQLLVFLFAFFIACVV
jgi:hypothetical protein